IDDMDVPLSVGSHRTGHRANIRALGTNDALGVAADFITECVLSSRIDSCEKKPHTWTVFRIAQLDLSKRSYHQHARTELDHFFVESYCLQRQRNDPAKGIRFSKGNDAIP